MDATTDAYLYAGVRMMGEVWKALNHTLLAAMVQLLGAGIVAWVLSERWQRWRQQRDFQHRAMVEFAETSTAVVAILHQVVRGASGKTTEDWNRLAREFSVRFESLSARDAQLYAVFEEQVLVQELYQLTRLISAIAQKSIQAMDTPLPKELTQQGMKAVSARRRLIIGRMAAEMQLRSHDAFGKLQKELGRDLTIPSEFAEPMASGQLGQAEGPPPPPVEVKP